MSRLITIIFILSLSIAAHARGPIEVNVPVDQVYVPYGFDSNDHTEMVVTGYLPNLCYQRTKYAVRRANANTFVVDIKANYLDGACAEVIVSYAQKVELGTLNPGNYKVIVRNGDKAIANYLHVSKAKVVNKDSFIYANVTDVTNVFGTDIIKIKGINPSDCFALDQIKVISNRKNSYSVLPILKKVRPDCRKKQTPFEYEFRVPDGLAPEQLLIHVRSMNGNAKNLIYNRFSFM